LPKTAPTPECSQSERQILEDWSRSRTLEARLVERARIVLGCLDGKPVSAVAASLKVRPNTVIDWRRRFETEGIAGLEDRARSGKPPRYTEEFRKQVLSHSGTSAAQGASGVGWPCSGAAFERLGTCGLAGTA